MSEEKDARAAANAADPMETADEEKHGEPLRYFVDLDSGEVHITAEHLSTTHAVEVRSREQINEVLGGKPAIAHTECFPEASPEDAKAAERPLAAAPPEAGGGAVDDETMTKDEYEAIPVAEPVTEAPPQG